MMYRSKLTAYLTGSIAALLPYASISVKTELTLMQLCVESGQLGMIDVKNLSARVWELTLALMPV